MATPPDDHHHTPEVIHTSDDPGRLINDALAHGAEVHIVIHPAATTSGAKAEDKPDPRAELSTGQKVALTNAFLKTGQGERTVKLYRLYPDPSVPLTRARVAELLERTGYTSPDSLFRFRRALKTAGAPTCTFQDVVPYLYHPGRHPGRQLSDTAHRLIERLLDERYFVPPGSRKSSYRCKDVADLVKCVREECQKRGLLKPWPSRNAVAARVQARYDANPVRATELRDGRGAADHLAARQGRLPLTHFGEVIALDATPVDLFVHLDGSVELRKVKHSRGKAQRPADSAIRAHLLQISEQISGLVLYAAVCKGAVAQHNALDALQHVMLNAFDRLAELGARNLPPRCGIPHLVRYDRGSEFFNKAMERAARELGFTLLPRAKWSRHHGGLEERHLGLVNHQTHNLRGTTFSSVAERGSYNAQKAATLLLDELTRFLVQVACDQHNMDSHPFYVGERRIDVALRLIEEGKVMFREPDAVQRAFLKEQMYPFRAATCQRDGIYFEGLVYTSPDLDRWIERRTKVLVLSDPEDIRTVRVLHEETGEVVVAGTRLPLNLDGPVSRREFKDYMAAARERCQDIRDSRPTGYELVCRIADDRERARHAAPRKRHGGRSLKEQRPAKPAEASVTIKATPVDKRHAPPKGEN
ncbi:Mu transposase C-terminal domain-containing protein [Deinococcus pimensis]|uniref:Mu transposase C-terminal domain-containing protein n=1 Tax=Deinococcus pimensis TaxID=309888 RepID=UPI0004B272FF|nr:Mu transposase C-terminal domain-containing protein [Deinococcus pimensis]